MKNDNDVSETDDNQIAEIKKDIAQLKNDSIGQEHRLLQVVRNAYHAVAKRGDWSQERRLEAGAALIRYFFFGRTTMVIAVGLGSLLALHASFMLSDQNRKLDLQNYGSSN